MSFHFSPKIVTDGLLLYLDVPNTRSYPGSGSSLIDLSSDNLSNGVTLYNDVGFDSNNLGSLVFDGVDTYTRTNSEFDLPEKITFSCWVKLDGQNLSQTLMGDFGQSNTLGYIWIFRASSNSNTLAFQYSNGTQFQSISANSFFLNFNDVWVNVTLSVDYDAGILRFYRNGSPFGGNRTMTTPLPPRSLYKYFGSYSTNQSILNGNISNIMIYNRILSETEILKNYNALKNRYL